MKTRLPRLRFTISGCLIVLLGILRISSQDAIARSREAFPLQVDHILVWVTKGAPEAQAFKNAGLRIQDRTNQHTGQGTASKVFIFENLYLELIWIDDEAVAAKNAARSGIDMTTRARWRETGASPFGVGLHRLTGSAGVIPFPVTNYWAEWMKPDTTIEFAQTVTDKREPMFFIVPDYISTGSTAMQEMLRTRLKATSHPLDVKRLSNLKIVTTDKKFTQTTRSLARSGIMKLERGKTALLELTFEGGGQRKSVDLRSELPVILKY